MAYHITIICVFLSIPENVTLRDTYVHALPASIDFIDAMILKRSFNKSLELSEDHCIIKLGKKQNEIT